MGKLLKYEMRKTWMMKLIIFSITAVLELAFVATLFLIVFYFIMTGLTVAGKAKNEAYLFAKIAVLISVFFWVISDIANLAASGMQGIFTAVFLGIDFMQIVTLGLWGILLPNSLKRTSETA